MPNYIDIYVKSKTENGWKVVIGDNYDTGYIILTKKPPVNDIKLLETVYKIVLNKEKNCVKAKRAADIFRILKDFPKGITIRNTFYEFSEFGYIFKGNK